MKRRDFLTNAAVGESLLTQVGYANVKQRRVKVAAIQFVPVLADVDANLAKCSKMVLEAIREGAQWIVLPEFFASGLAMDQRMWTAYRPIDGEPTRFLKEVATKHGVHIGGSFLAQSGRDVFNTFVLAAPNGRTLTHDKDFPSTVFESSFYAGGEDVAYSAKLRKEGFKTIEERIEGRKDNSVDGVLELGELNVGVALCWELVRYRTARRLRGKIDLLFEASGWWWASPDFEWPGMTQKEIAQSRQTQLGLIRNAPRQLAKMTGAPVLHANFAGVNRSYTDHTFSKQISARFLGQSQIVDSHGQTVAILDDRPGIAIGEVEIGETAEPIGSVGQVLVARIP